MDAAPRRYLLYLLAVSLSAEVNGVLVQTEIGAKSEDISPPNKYRIHKPNSSAEERIDDTTPRRRRKRDTIGNNPEDHFPIESDIVFGTPHPFVSAGNSERFNRQSVRDSLKDRILEEELIDKRTRNIKTPGGWEPIVGVKVQRDSVGKASSTTGKLKEVVDKSGNGTVRRLNFNDHVTFVTGGIDPSSGNHERSLGIDVDVLGSSFNWWKCAFGNSTTRCLKIALLRRVNDFVGRYKHVDTPCEFMDGMVTMEKIKNETEDSEWDWRRNDPKKRGKRYDPLDLRLVDGLSKIFSERTLKMSFFPGVELRVVPDKDAPALVRLVFKYVGLDADRDLSTAREGASKKKKKEGLGMLPWMLVGPLVSLGFLPFVLANLKMMVMAAVALNNFALSSAVFAAIRQTVFGNHPGGNVIYRNDGYKNEEKLYNHPYRGHTIYGGTLLMDNGF